MRLILLVDFIFIIFTPSSDYSVASIMRAHFAPYLHLCTVATVHAPRTPNDYQLYSWLDIILIFQGIFWRPIPSNNYHSARWRVDLFRPLSRIDLFIAPFGGLFSLAHSHPR
jgi:hypothetical protein